MGRLSFGHPLLTEEQCIKIVSLYREGYSLREVARTVGCSYAGAHKVIDKSDVPFRPKGWPGKRVTNITKNKNGIAST
jgi:hypothetical protein